MKKRLLTVFKFTVSFLLLGWLLRSIPVADIVQSFAAANVPYVAAGLLVIAPINLINAFQLKYLTRVQGFSLSAWEIVKVNLTSSFYALFLPGVIAGGAARWYKLAQHDKRRVQALAVVVFNRFLETLVLVLVGIGFSVPEIIQSGRRELLLVWVGVAAFLMACYGLLLNTSFLRFLANMLSMVPLPRYVKEKLNKFIVSMGTFSELKMKDHVAVFGLLLSKNICGVFSIALLAKALSLTVGFWEIGWVRSVIMIMSFLPISFSGLGVREVTLVVLLERYGVLPPAALALSFLILFRNLMSPLAGGVWELFDAGRSRAASSTDRRG